MSQFVEYKGEHAIINLPHTKYLDKVLRSKSYEELMWRFLPAESPSKEITESYAAFSNIKKVCLIHQSNWLHIGDGAHTRTAAIFTFNTKCVNFSIDPALNMDKFEQWKTRYNVKNLIALKNRYEEVDPEYIKSFNDKGYNICCVHAHVTLEDVDRKFPEWTFLYTNPCCQVQNQTFSKKYMKDNNIIEVVNREDLGILSDKRQVIIYKKIRK